MTSPTFDQRGLVALSDYNAYSKIVGYSLKRTLAVEGCLNALKMALATLKQNTAKLIHHSDRVHGTVARTMCNCWNKISLKSAWQKTVIPYEKSVAERVNGILKEELCLGNVFKTSIMLLQCYRSCCHLQWKKTAFFLWFLTPFFSAWTGRKTKKRWTNYYQKTKQIKGKW